MHKYDISVIVPVYNEEGNIANLNNEIHEEVRKITSNYEVIYVNDGSRDGSLADLKKLSHVTVINLNKNYGQATAFDAGFKYASGEIVVTLDGDGQNDPKDIQKLLDKMKEGDFDVVAGWRKTRKDKSGIKILTRIGRFLRRVVIGDMVHDTGCSLRVYKSEAAKSLDIGGEMHRYILALLKFKGFKIGEVVVNDRARLHGVSKYNYSKALKGFIDLLYIWFIYKYFQRPIHLFGYMSLTSFALGTLSGFWTVYGKIFMSLSLNRNGWALVTFFFLLCSILLFSFGIIIDLLIRISFNSSQFEKRYYIREIIKQ
jgi:glycosyltransferase involved in cell wall biosynthesis